MDIEKDCSNCKYQDQAADWNDEHTRCGNCLMLTRKGKSHWPMWEEKDDGTDETDPPKINYI